MKLVRYRRPRAGFSRVLRVKDLDQLGIKHKGEDLVWNKDNNFQVVMNNQMSESLVEKLPGEFSAMDTDEADEAPEVPEPLTHFTPNDQSDDSVDNPDESAASGDDEAKASTRKGSKTQ